MSIDLPTDDIQAAIFQALGAASVCWESMEHAGIFDSTRAKEIGDELYQRVEAYAREAQPQAALTEDELATMDTTAKLAEQLAQVVGNRSTREADLAELYAHLHAIQQAVLSQAAARAYPDRFRLLGQSLGDAT